MTEGEMEIICGHGQTLVGVVRNPEGHVGVMLRPSDGDSHEIGEECASWKTGESYEAEEGDIMIWLQSLQSARVLQDNVNLACLELNKYFT